MSVERLRIARKIVVAIVVLAALGAVLRVVGVIHGRRIEPGTRPLAGGAVRSAASARSERIELPLFELAPGTVTSRRRATVAAQANARVVSVTVAAGTPVRGGQELARLDDRELVARVEQARAGLGAAAAARARAVQSRAQADARQTQAEAHLARIRSFARQNAATAEQLEAAEADAQTARAEVTAAAAAVDAADADERRSNEVVNEAEVARGHAQVVAPIAGVVVERLVEPGDLAWAGRPLFTVHDPAQLRLSAQVREGLIARVAVGDRLTVELSAVEKRVDAVLAELLPAADPRSASFEVRADFDAPPGVYPGMFGRLRVPAGTRTLVRAPARALVRVGQLEFVEVRDGAVVARRFVTIGERFPDGSVEVLSGLRGGEELVLEPEP